MQESSTAIVQHMPAAGASVPSVAYPASARAVPRCARELARCGPSGRENLRGSRSNVHNSVHSRVELQSGRMIPLQTHTESCNMRLLYCMIQPRCRWTAPHRSNLLPQRPVTALRASASAFNSGFPGPAFGSHDADADRCAVCCEPVLLSASTPHDLPLSRLLLLPPGRCVAAALRPQHAQHAVRSGRCVA